MLALLSPLVVLLLGAAPRPSLAAPGAQGFIRAQGGAFVDEACNGVYYAGWNG
jgi:hypothetical protein